MALTKFSSFKKERATIKESRAKEVKVKKFNKLFSEKLKELKVASVADLSEDQMNSFLESLKKEKVVNGQRMKSKTGTMGCVIKEDDFGSGTFFDVGYPVRAVYKRIFIKHRQTRK